MDKALIGIFVAAAAATLIFLQARLKHREPGEVQVITYNPSSPETVNENCFSKGLRWPMDGVPGRDWVIANYVDHDEGKNRTRDYWGAVGADAVTYDGHEGVDIELADFRVMDAGVPVFAAADGFVEDIFDTSFDRNTHCSSERWNFVKLKHAGGMTTIYGHLKRGSILVRPGAAVTTGMKLGLVGSSGCSIFPHLHFEVRDCQGRVIDSVKESMFSNMPEDVRSSAPAVMNVSLFQPEIDSILPIQNPETGDREVISISHPFSVGVTVSALKAGDVLSFEFLSPRGENMGAFFQRSMPHFLPRSHWWGNFLFDSEGTWKLLVKVNGRTLVERSIIATR